MPQPDSICISEPQEAPTVELTQQNATYIMQGNALRKALDIYHLILAPTHACNLRCRHCYLPDHHKDLLPKEVALKLVDEWSEIILEERGRYGGIFHLKGGEPFVVPYFGDIVERAKQLQSLRFMITTNGTFGDEDILDGLQSCNDALDGHLTTIVSLDGASEETHSILRGPNNFAKTLRFLSNLDQRQIRFYLNCVLHSGNIEELSSYVELAKSYGASQVNFLSFVPRGIGSGFKEFQLPHLEVYHRVADIYDAADEETKNLLAGSLPDIKYRELTGLHRTSHECVAAYRGMLYITPDGNAYTCPNIVYPEFSVGNVLHDTLKLISHCLPDLHRNVASHNKAYTCAGEELLYSSAEDIPNKVSLTNLTMQLTANKLIDDPAAGSSPQISYCYSRNW